MYFSSLCHVFSIGFLWIISHALVACGTTSRWQRIHENWMENKHQMYGVWCFFLPLVYLLYNFLCLPFFYLLSTLFRLQFWCTVSHPLAVPRIWCYFFPLIYLLHNLLGALFLPGFYFSSTFCSILFNLIFKNSLSSTCCSTQLVFLSSSRLLTV